MTYTNIAFYHFFQVNQELEHVRLQLKAICGRLRLRGTILLAQEGINLMVAGRTEDMEDFRIYLRDLIGIQDLFFKESHSDHVPFNRMNIKVKQQIIPVNDPDIDPAEFTAPHLEPEELEQWLDAGKEVILLDTRNKFEYEIGSFAGAHASPIDNFRDFETCLNAFPAEWKDKPVVTFCTGGVRCEKASPIMLKQGYKEVYQLNGGILNYFEKVGGKHYEGDCFVFDRRVALKTNLEEANVVECFVCRHPVTENEQKLETYQLGISCPYCHSKDTHDA